MRILLLLLALSGCKLIDQTTFYGEPPGQSELARARPPAMPLVTIRYEQGDPDLHDILAPVVEAAQARKPDVVFDVLTPMPTQASPEVRDRFAAQGEADAKAVATGLAAEGVNQDHIHMGFRGDAGNPPREVLIYVR